MNSQVVLGLWPIAGITTVGVTESDAQRTIAAALDAGITQFDTAYSYGYDGESDRLLGQGIRSRRDQVKIVGKVGQRWTADRKRVNDGSPATLTANAEDSLRRLGTEYFDTLMLHCPGDATPIEESAHALVALQQRGLCKRIGVCNVNVAQYQSFQSAAAPQALQCPLNLMQRDRLDDLIPVCRDNACDVYVFWTLMKGLLAGKISRDHQFDPDDIRPSYPVFQGDQRERAHRVLDGLQKIAHDLDKTVAQITIGWAISQVGVTAALVGARRPDQIRETAQATRLDAETLKRIDAVAK